MEGDIKKAMDVLRKEMASDTELGSYAYSWHCHIARACYDAMLQAPVYTDPHAISNDAASRVMYLCFDVIITNEEE